MPKLSDADREAAGLLPLLEPHEWRLIECSLRHLRWQADYAKPERGSAETCCTFVVTELDRIITKLEKINAHHDAAEE